MGSTTSSPSAAIPSPPASIEPPGLKPSRPGPRSPAWPLGHKPSCDRPSCALSRPEPIKLTVPADCLAAVSRVGVSVDRYSFTVTDLHRLPPADLPAHRGSMAGLHDPLPTLRPWPRGQTRTARGRRGSLLLRRIGLPPTTPGRSPGALPSPDDQNR